MGRARSVTLPSVSLAGYFPCALPGTFATAPPQERRLQRDWVWPPVDLGSAQYIVTETVSCGFHGRDGGIQRQVGYRHAGV